MASQTLYRAAEKALYAYHKHKAVVNLHEARDTMKARAQDGTGGVKTSGISDPTARDGVALATPAKEVLSAKLWVWAIETAWAEMEAFDPEKARLMVEYYGLERYEDRPKRLQPIFRAYIMDKLHISYRTFYSWKNDCVDAVIHAAIQCGALVPYKRKTPA